MQEEQISEALNKHWQASATGDSNAEHDTYDENAICDYAPVRRANPQAKKFAGPAKSSSRRAVRFQR